MEYALEKRKIEEVYKNRTALFQTDTGMPYEQLKEEALLLAEHLLSDGEPRILIRAKVFAFLMDNAQIAVHPDEPFADLVNCEGIMHTLCYRWQSEVREEDLRDYPHDAHRLWFYRPAPDYGHLCPDWDAVVSLGLPGLLTRLENREGNLYEAGRILYTAILRLVGRLEAAAHGINDRNARNLHAIADHAPQTSEEAYQLITLMFRLLEYVDGERTRSLGGLDRILYPFWRNERNSETCFEDNLALFLLQAWSMRVPYDLPFFIGGTYKPELEEAERVAEVIVSVYSKLDIYSPKIHVRVAANTGSSLIRLTCDSIRRNNSSFVFVSDETAVKSLESVGISHEDATEYVLIGCYEPAAYKKEIPCTGNCVISLAKAVELALNNGIDPMSGKQIGVPTGDPNDFTGFEEFYDAVKQQLAYAVSQSQKIIRAYERHYGEVYPVPLLSVTYESCLESGIDALEGGATYNNSSIIYMGIGTAADSLLSVKAVYEKQEVSIQTLLAALRADWNGYETEQAYFLNLPKYGNNKEDVDSLAVRLATDAAEMTRCPNARGGLFKAGLFSIDHVHPAGRVTGATPDGRKTGMPLSKNLCPTTGMDKNGLTATMLSSAKLCLKQFPDGSVLDIMLHPSAVSGEEGLDIFENLIRTYFRLGGFAVHGNVISAETLLHAQADPGTYANLQVRLCGWNVFFVNLSKAEQDELIRAAQ